jgi:peptide-methionine (S)-S-oxide reductase
MRTAFMLGLALCLIVMNISCNFASASATTLPDPAYDAPLANTKGVQTAVLAGGCFWGIEAVFEHVKGVNKVTSGYSGGSGDTAQYSTVGTGETGHAESVRISYDPSQISYRLPMILLS